MAKPQRIAKDGRTYYRVQIRRPTKGITLDEWFTTKRGADVFLRRVERALEDGSPIAQNVRSRETFSEAATAFLDDAASSKTNKGRQLKPSAQKSLHERVGWLSRECFGGVLMKHLTWELIDAKLAEKTLQRKWTNASRYRYETALSRFLDYAKKQRWIVANPLHGQQRLNETEKRLRTFTDGEWQSLLEKADARNDMLAMFLRLAWATGCRRSELLRLRWVDLEAIQHKQLGARIELRDTKNREDRAVFISRDLYHLLEAHEQRYRKSSSPLVFPARTRSGLYNVSAPFGEARKAAKLDSPDERYGEILSIHHIRHSWATRLGDQGATLAQLMSAGGWKTAQMAMRYMKRKESQAMEAAALLH